MPEAFYDLTTRARDTYQARPYWVMTDEVLKASTENFGSLYAKFTNAAFRVLGTVPEDYVVRMPFYNRQYKAIRDRLIREYSQGMRRRTALAAALVAQPPLLVLDEALNGLDPPSAARVVQALRAACDAGQAVLLSTHVLDTLERIADRVVMLQDGAVLADVPAAELDRVRGLFAPH